MRLSDDFLYELKSRNDLEQLVSSYVNLKRRGSTSVGLCPFHNEKTPSFTVYTDNGSYYCFGCGAGGDIITFTRSIENLDYIEAVRFLAARANITVPENDFDDSMHRLRTEILSINREAARFFHTKLTDKTGKDALEYLRRRGISDQTITKFGLGFSPDSWTLLFDHLRAKGHSPDAIAQADLARQGSRGYFDRFVNRVMFPIIDLRGNVIAFGGRAMPSDNDKKTAKYLNSGDTPVYKKSRNIYALNLAKNSQEKSLILTEGYMDTIALHQAGFTSAIAALGTAFTAEQAKLLSRYGEEVVITLDADEAGQRATRRAMEILGTTGMPVRVLKIPEGKDPDDYIREHGPQRFKALLEGASNDIEYQLLEIRDKYDISSDGGKNGYLSDAVLFLAKLYSDITRDIYASRLSEECAVSKEAILLQISSARKKYVAQSRKKEQNEALAPRRDQLTRESGGNIRLVRAQEIILSILMKFPDLFEAANSRLTPQDFPAELYSRVYSAIMEILKRGTGFEISLISADFDPNEMGSIARLQNTGISGDNAEKELTDCINVIFEEKEKSVYKDKSKLGDDEFLDIMKMLKEKKTK